MRTRRSFLAATIGGLWGIRMWKRGDATAGQDSERECCQPVRSPIVQRELAQLGLRTVTTYNADGKRISQKVVAE